MGCCARRTFCTFPFGLREKCFLLLCTCTVLLLLCCLIALPVFLGFLFRKQELQWIYSKLKFCRFQGDTQSFTKPRPASKNVQEIKTRHCLKQWLSASWLSVSELLYICCVSQGYREELSVSEELLGIPQVEYVGNALSIEWVQSTSVRLYSFL